jgi:hypothetical protein
MTEKIIKSLYNDEVSLVFYPNSHRYKIEGKRTCLPSVTSVTGVIDKSRPLILWATRLTAKYLKKYLEDSSVNKFTSEELIPIIDEAVINYKDVQDEALGVGTQAHDWAEQFALAQINGSDIPTVPDNATDELLNSINGFIDWYDKNNVKFLEVERMVYSKSLEYVVIFDAVAEVNGKKVVLEYKTSKSLYTEYRFQASAYVRAYEEETEKDLDGYILLNFGKESGVFDKLEVFDKKEVDYDFQTFMACLTIKNSLKKLDKWGK